MKEKIINFLDDSEELILLIASRIAPLAAPLGPSIMVRNSLIEQLHIGPLPANFMGASVELVGIAAIHLSVQCWLWNQTRRKTDPVAPFNMTVWLSIGYLFSAMALSIALEVLPQIAPFAPVFFFVLAFVAYVSLALGSQLTRWKNDRVQEAEQRAMNTERIQQLNKQIEQLNDLLNAERSTVEHLNTEIERSHSTVERLTVQVEQLENVQLNAEQADLNSSTRSTLNDKEGALNALLNVYRSNPNATLNEAGSIIERSKATVSNYLNELEQTGLIYRNGDGIEVLDNE